MKRAMIGGAVMALVITTTNAAPDQYLCIAESAAGLHYDARSRAWKPRAFTTDERKYILRRINADDLKKYGPALKSPEMPGRNLTETDLAIMRIDCFFFVWRKPAPVGSMCGRTTKWGSATHMDLSSRGVRAHFRRWHELGQIRDGLLRRLHRAGLSGADPPGS